jgi:hypothetical protein
MVPAVKPGAEGSSPSRPFNSPLECGFRMLFVLDASRGKPADLQRLISYDYLLVHSGDVADGPESLHPPVPYRGSELLVKREVLSAGLNQMFARELIAKTFDRTGILYHATELTSAFVDDLRLRSKWLIEKFDGMRDAELNSYVSSNVGRWGAEFERLSAIKDLEL